jgi:alpha-galactosidase
MNRTNVLKLSSKVALFTGLFGMLLFPAQLKAGEVGLRDENTAPQINGPAVFGIRPEHPLLYTVPATGARPMEFSAEKLPPGLFIEAQSGILRGILTERGEYPVVLKAHNAFGTVSKQFLIKCGDEISLTPVMGWNSWNCWGDKVDHDKIIRAARAMVASGLVQHGWVYINIDDGWQGRRTGADHALQGNEKFPDMKKLSDEVHALGLKLGVYSTPWIVSYAGYPGGSSENAAGDPLGKKNGDDGHRHGSYDFIESDARQWSAWGIDYLKYDWAPLDLAHARRAYEALENSGRDIVLSLSNAADLALASQWSKVANSWRTTGDIGDRWQYAKTDAEPWRYGVSEIAFSQDAWADAARPGHWNDADMLVVGRLGWGTTLRSTHLSRDEQYSHITLWCLLGSPLLLGCDLEQLDEFTISLLSNDEVLALNQDSLGKQAVRVATVGSIEVYRKALLDGSCALGFINRSGSEEKFLFNKLKAIGLGGPRKVRDLWRRRDLPDCNGEIEGTVAGHGVLLLRLTP